MESNENSGAALAEAMKRKAPELLDLVTARTDEEFEVAFDAVLGRAIAGLEENSAHLASLNENGLSGVLRLALSAPGLHVSQEKHSNGHVDLTIEAIHTSPVRKKLAEAKIYDGYKYHVSGLEQLIGRYSTGREGRGLLIVYCKKPNIASLMARLREQMNQELPCKQDGIAKDHTHKWSFVTAHGHSSGESLEVGHVGCNLHCGD